MLAGPELSLCTELGVTIIHAPVLPQFSELCGMSESSGTHRSDALYQGTTSVGHRPNKNPGFSPWAFFGPKFFLGK